MSDTSRRVVAFCLLRIAPSAKGATRMPTAAEIRAYLAKLTYERALPICESSIIRQGLACGFMPPTSVLSVCTVTVLNRNRRTWRDLPRAVRDLPRAVLRSEAANLMSLELEGVPFFIVSSTQRGGQWIGVVRFGVGKVASRLQFMVHLRGYSGPGPTVADIQKAVEDKDAYRAALGQAVAAMRGGPGGISGRARVARVVELVPREPPQITSGSMLSLFAFVWFKDARRRS